MSKYIKRLLLVLNIIFIFLSIYIGVLIINNWGNEFLKPFEIAKNPFIQKGCYINSVDNCSVKYLNNDFNNDFTRIDCGSFMIDNDYPDFGKGRFQQSSDYDEILMMDCFDFNSKNRKLIIF